MLFIPAYIAEQLKKASYEYDPAARAWCAWAPQLPGAYAQADSVEAARNQLAEVIEDYLIVALEKGKSKQLFKKFNKPYAAAQPAF